MIYTSREEAILNFCKKHRDFTRVDELKLIYGFRIFMMDAKKMVVLYFLAFTLGITVELMLVQIGFMLFRQVAYGVHFPGFWSCLISSVIIFLGGTYFFGKINVTQGPVLILFSICVLILTLLAPISSKKIKIRGTAHRRYLRRKMYKRFLVMLIAIVVLPLGVSAYLIFGMSIETIVICYSRILMKKGENINV